MTYENFTKVDEHTLSTDKVVPTETKTVTYSYEYLLSQKEAIQNQKDSDNALRDAELADVDLLIAEAEKLGIK